MAVDASVTFLLAKLTEFIQVEENLLSGVREEAKYINDELDFMRAFLRVADTIEEKDDQLKVLVTKVRDIAYDVEDALDDFKLRLPRDNGHGCYAPLQKVTHFARSLKARHEIASAILDLKSRVISVSEQHRRYIIKKNIMEQGSGSTTTSSLARQGDAFLLAEANLVGIDVPKRQLIDRLFGSDSERGVVSVVGMGGLGKTTLVKQVYDDADVKKYFKFRAWVTISQPFKIDDLLRYMIQQLYRVVRKANPQGTETMDTNRLRMKIYKFLLQKRYLIVLDDVWNIHSWEAFQQALPENSFGSRILLTTRNAGVASASCFGSPDMIYNMSPLSPEASWTLFCKKTFQKNPCPPHLKNVSERILARCEGLPLAIVAISGVLSTKESSRIDEWEMVHRRLGTGLEDNDKLKRMRKVLSLSYNDLPYYLKSCLLYFSIFPEGYPVKSMQLVRLWIAEGFVKEKDGMTVEEVAEDYLNELIKRSMVQVMEATSDGRVKTCRIHDLLREIVMSKSKDQGFVTIAKDQSMGHEKVRRLSIQNAMTSIQPRHTGSQPRSLLFFWGPTDTSSDLPTCRLALEHLRLLNVLDLEGAPLKQFPSEVFRLFLLKYLSLRNTKVGSIPSSIGKLRNLETLDMKHAEVAEVPNEILKLQKLRNLLVYRYEFDSDDRVHTKYGFKTPAKVGDLQSMQKLCFLEATSDQLVELRRLCQLRRLGIVKLRRENGKVLCTSIELLKELRALSVTSTGAHEIIDMEHLSSPPPFLQRLYLNGRLERLPEWVSSLDSLVKLVLKWSRLSSEQLLSLPHLPNLAHLEFIEAYEGEVLQFTSDGFQRLKFLGLNKLDGLKMIVVEQGAMPCLEKLIVQSCKSLEGVPLGTENLTKLKVLEFFDMPNEFIKRLRPGEEGKDYLKVQNVPEVYCTYKTDGDWDVYSVEGFKKGQKVSAELPHREHDWKP